MLALQESYLQGVSTRKVRKITDPEACKAKLCGVEFSKDQVSRMARAPDEELGTWRSRRDAGFPAPNQRCCAAAALPARAALKRFVQPYSAAPRRRLLSWPAPASRCEWWDVLTKSRQESGTKSREARGTRSHKIRGAGTPSRQTAWTQEHLVSARNEVTKPSFGIEKRTSPGASRHGKLASIPGH